MNAHSPKMAPKPKKESSSSSSASKDKRKRELGVQRNKKLLLHQQAGPVMKPPPYVPPLPKQPPLRKVCKGYKRPANNLDAMLPLRFFIGTKTQVDSKILTYFMERQHEKQPPKFIADYLNTLWRVASVPEGTDMVDIPNDKLVAALDMERGIGAEEH